MRKKILALAVLLAACGREADPPPQQDIPVTQSADIQVEGEIEEVSLQPFQSPPDFALPFATSIPASMRAQPLPADSGDAVRFVDSGNPAAYLHLFVQPLGYTADAAEENIRAVAESYGVPGVGEVEPTERFPWALAQYRFERRGSTAPPVAGFVALGQHAGRFFHVIVQHPLEWGDGFVPRARLILDQWRWADTGGGLEQVIPTPVIVPPDSA